MIHSKGLNGFWGSLWNGIASVFGASELTEDVNNTGRIVGTKIGRFLKNLLTVYTAGIVSFKNEYIPTAQELLILNLLKTSLNNYMISLINGVDAFFLANTNTQERIIYYNNAIRKIQIIQNYFALNLHPGLSSEAQQLMSDEIRTLLKSFELTIEDLLDQNGIEYTKTIGDLVVNPSDTYPSGINIPANEYAYGHQYVVANSETTVISISVPTNTTSLIPNQATVITEEIAGLQTTKKTSLLVPAILLLVAITAALIPSEKSEKEK